MKRTILFRVAISMVLGAALAVPASAQVGPSSGKNSAFVQDFLAAVLPSSAPGVKLAEVGLLKGKKKRNLVLDVEADYSNTAEDVFPVVRVEINGIDVSAGHGLSDWCEVHGLLSLCSVSRTFWVDLDALEAANPGLIVKQPLVVSVWMYDLLGATSATTGPVTLAARFEKK